MSNHNIQALLAFACVFASGTAYAGESDNIQKPVTLQHQVEEVVSRLVGAMDTSAQANVNSKAPDVRITTCKVKIEDMALNRPQTVFLYQEQALSQRLSQPYRQRFLRIAPRTNNLGVESAVFKPPTPKAWVGLCKKPEAERIVPTNALGESNCSVSLQRSGETYIGETVAGGCPSDYKGAVRITNRIILHQTGMDTWDRGFDATGNQVWGAKDKPYQFRRIVSIPDANSSKEFNKHL